MASLCPAVSRYGSNIVLCQAMCVRGPGKVCAEPGQGADSTAGVRVVLVLVVWVVGDGGAGGLGGG